MLANGTNFNIRVAGSGPPIVLLHGFAGNISTWEYFVEKALNEYTLIAVDLLGHGATDSPKEKDRYSVEKSIEDFTCILDKLHFDRACWLGYSMGGRIALAAAALNPKKCDCLVIESASPGLKSREERENRVRSDNALADLIEEKGVDAFVDYWEQQPLFASQKLLSLETRDQIRHQRLKNNVRGLANTLRAAGTGAQPAVHHLLPTLKIPVLCIAGESDAKFTSIAREMGDLLPNVNVSIIPGAGHAPHLEKPKEFAEIVLAFLKQRYNVGSFKFEN